MPTSVTDQLFTDFVTGDVITGAHLNSMKNELATIDDASPEYNRQVTATGPIATYVIAASSSIALAYFRVNVPAGKKLTLERVAYQCPDASGTKDFRASVTGGTTWTAMASAHGVGEEAPGATLYDNSGSGTDFLTQVTVQVVNYEASAYSLQAAAGIWVHFGIR